MYQCQVLFVDHLFAKKRFHKDFFLTDTIDMQLLTLAYLYYRFVNIFLFFNFDDFQVLLSYKIFEVTSHDDSGHIVLGTFILSYVNMLHFIPIKSTKDFFLFIHLEPFKFCHQSGSCLFVFIYFASLEKQDEACRYTTATMVAAGRTEPASIHI